MAAEVRQGPAGGSGAIRSENSARKMFRPPSASVPVGSALLEKTIRVPESTARAWSVPPVV